MNFLSHHHVARNAARRDAPPELFLGNVLPDLLSRTGGGRLRAGNLPPAASDTSLTAGIRLHLAADAAFHGGDAFKRLSAEAGDHLRRQPFAEPPRRLFFVAHVFVELALDAHLLDEEPGIADDLYARIADADTDAAARETAGLMGRPDGIEDRAQDIARHVRWFTEARYLQDYREPEGLSEAMRRINGRAGLQNFVSRADARRLASAFASFRPELRRAAPDLLRVPPTAVGPWYNGDETTTEMGRVTRELHPPGRDEEDADGDA